MSAFGTFGSLSRFRYALRFQNWAQLRLFSFFTRFWVPESGTTYDKARHIFFQIWTYLLEVMPEFGRLRSIFLQNFENITRNTNSKNYFYLPDIVNQNNNVALTLYDIPAANPYCSELIFRNMTIFVYRPYLPRMKTIISVVKKWNNVSASHMSAINQVK